MGGNLIMMVSITRWSTLFFCCCCTGAILYGVITLSTRYEISMAPVSHIPPPNLQPTTETVPKRPTQHHTFQTLSGKSMYVFSAFLDKGAVRVLGIKLHNYNGPIQCQVRMAPIQGSPGQLVKVKAIIHTLPEHHNKIYRACFILCPVPDNSTPRSVSMTSQSSNVTLDLKTSQTWRSEFTVCVAPIHHGYNQQFGLVEMIELNRILGAEKFFFYNLSVGSDVDKVLKHYMNKQLVEVIQWPLPVSPQDVHYYGQMAAINDCVYRNRHWSRHVVITDMDEFIVPGRNWTSWKEVIRHRKSVQPKATSFQFRNVFFWKDWTVEPGGETHPLLETAATKWKSVVLQKIYKEDRVYGYKLRSKCIVDPLSVETAGIHFPWKSLGYEDNVPVQDGLLHHYRTYQGGFRKKKVKDDSVVRKFGVKIVENLETAWKEIKASSVLRSL